jgi:hypothetical protein
MECLHGSGDNFYFLISSLGGYFLIFSQSDGERCERETTREREREEKERERDLLCFFLERH